MTDTRPRFWPYDTADDALAGLCELHHYQSDRIDKLQDRILALEVAVVHPAPAPPPTESGFDAVEVSLADPFAETDEAAPPFTDSEVRAVIDLITNIDCGYCMDGNDLGDEKSCPDCGRTPVPPPKPEGCGRALENNGSYVGDCGNDGLLCPSCSGAGG